MKKTKYKFFKGLCILSVLSLASCLKDNPKTFTLDGVSTSFSELNPINYLNLTANGGGYLANLNSYFMTLRLDSSGLATDSVQLQLGGPMLNKDVTVTVDLDNTGFNAFNAKNGNAYQLLPPDYYTIPNKQVTFKAGTRDQNIYIQFKNTKQIDFSKKYILPIMITDAQGYDISGNFGSTMYALVAGNKYMGLYNSVGQRVMGKNTYSINDLKYLHDLSGLITLYDQYPSAGGNGVTLPTSFIPNSVVLNAADQTIYASIGQQMDLTVNPDNSVTVTNDYLYGFGIQTYDIVSGPSTYDPINHVFNLNYGFKDPWTGDSAVVKEVMTLIR